MKKFIKIFAIVIVLLTLTACGKKKNGDVAVDPSSNAIKIVCTSGNLGDEVIEMTSVVTATYSEDRVIQSKKTEITEIVNDKSAYETRKNTYSNSYAKRENTDTIEYTYSYDDKTNTFKYSTYEKKIDLNSLTEDEKTNNEIPNFLKSYEDGNYTCKLTGITRAELGLEEK